MIYYPLSLHLQKAYGFLGCKKGDFPESERVQEEVISLPMYPELREEQVPEVAKGIKGFVKLIKSNPWISKQPVMVLTN